ncbi:cytochrome B [Ideonella dechloratans]|uniref:Cytochrome B n=1 Tax=Ideonella dechloratans TaxID=36863 RepID=A0A643FC56_IDEDE|nr:cytochrome b/b6 domain-containing protein [Ideonella dechloratans]KAB0582464.1 cytochrome B [Ideonella dechloratans]UFU10507.1 cytochrome b/b6 domain-containing protein [Ideonella dechloratans]
MSATPPRNTPAATAPVRVWDLPTRLFHWGLLAVVVALFVSGKVGGNAMDWHVRLGLGAGVLVVFRLAWGLVGGRWSRFASFVKGPVTVWRYLRGQLPVPAGHNPLGALSVLALLAVLALQVATGLVADDEIATVGPLNALVPEDWASWGTRWHKGPGQTLLLVLVGLHVAAILFHRLVKRHDLVRPMLTGDQALPADTPPSRDSALTRLAALGLLGLCAAGAVWVSRLGG